MQKGQSFFSNVLVDCKGDINFWASVLIMNRSEDAAGGALGGVGVVLGFWPWRCCGLRPLTLWTFVYGLVASSERKGSSDRGLADCEYSSKEHRGD